MRLWIASLLFYLFIYLVCEVLRLIINVAFRRRPQSFTRRLMLEFVGTLQVCVPMFDINIILDTYGLYGVFIEVSFLELANTLLLRDAIAHPCALVTAVNKRPNTARQAIMVFIAELFAGFSASFLARFFWSFGIHPIHEHMLQLEVCDADLKVAILIGCLIEGVATFSSKAIEYYDQYQDLVTPSILNCFFSGFLTVLGIKYTGLYANPIVAWSCTFNCEGITHLGHLAVYWVAPIVGWHFADVVFANADCNLNSDEGDSKKD